MPYLRTGRHNILEVKSLQMLAPRAELTESNNYRGLNCQMCARDHSATIKDFSTRCQTVDVPSRSPAATLLKELPAIALGTPPRSPVSASWGRCLAALRARSPDRAELDDWQQAVEDGRPVAQRDLVLGPSLHRRPICLQRDQIVADGGNLLDQVLAGRIVPAVNGVGVVLMGPPCPDRSTGRVGRERLLLVTPRN